MLIFRNAEPAHNRVLFSIFHPGHVVLSAMVTASLFQRHRKAKDFLRVLLIGYLGSVGIATLSDCIVPYCGERILGAAVPSHAALHDPTAPAGQACNDPSHDHAGHDHANHDHAEHDATKPHLHLGFIEEWYLVNPAALLGVLIAFFLPRTRYPHAIHVLVSTWASSAHMLMNTQADWTGTLLAGMFIVLFIAVWLPCCISDIIFPMLFVDSTPEHQQCWLCGPKKKGGTANRTPQ